MKTPSTLPLAALVGLLHAHLPLVSAQTSFLYKWKFNDPTIQTTIPSCTPLPITISSFDTATNATRGTPPYYMVAFGISDDNDDNGQGGRVSTQLIGLNDKDVSFTLDHAPNTRVLLEVFDANGNPGGTYAPMIVSGGSTSCIPPSPSPSSSPSFFFTHNITTTLPTCAPLGLTISGGTPPYNITLVAANSPAVTNVTLPAGDNVYTYVSRAAPGGQLVVAVSDAKGTWASGTALFATEGSTDTDCAGLLSSSSKTTLPAPPASSPPASSSGSSPAGSASGSSTPGSGSASATDPIMTIQTNTATPTGDAQPAPTSGAGSMMMTMMDGLTGALVAVVLGASAVMLV